MIARHCSEVRGASEKILGIVHGVMPTTGAAAVYRRFKSGTEGSIIAAAVLGRNAGEMTAVLAAAPGPLQLLPSEEYGSDWLIIKDEFSEFKYPVKSNPYSEIYAVRGKWWSMCDDKLINPGIRSNAGSENSAAIDSEWNKYANIIFEKVKPFHVGISKKYHANTYLFFGCHSDHKAYGNVTWKGVDDIMNDLLLRNRRPADVLNGKNEDPEIAMTTRNINTALFGKGWKKEQRQIYTISAPDEDGDGTVPRRSGIFARENVNVKSVLQVSVSHEAAYRDSDLARNFTLRAIVKISLEIENTTLKY